VGGVFISLPHRKLSTHGAEADEIVSAKEGDSFTLRTGFTERQDDLDIEWRFGLSRTLLIKIKSGNIITSSDTIFRDRLLLDRQTGDLTITNIKNEHTGAYELSDDVLNKVLKFIVTVYAPVPVPVITRYSPQCSSSSLSSSSSSSSSSGFKRVLLCSVVNVSHVTLSWYKGNSLLSNISVSDFSIGLSLPLEVEYQDINSYSCVVNNPVSTQTTHLDIDQLCQTCSDCDYYWSQTTEAVIRLVVSAVVGVAAVAAVVVLFYDIRSRRAGLERKN
uniref:Ig-like domain-containing protein n=1 Tax=Cyprinus carpio carpio TaxID=630221 RepID=A0A9J8AH22_CYPCA